MKKTRRAITLLLISLLLGGILLNLYSCTLFTVDVKAENLMEGISPNDVTGKATDDKFIGNTADFSVNLFKETITDNKNSLISPLSVLLALSMTANGADNNTLKQMETVLGKDIPISDLNEYLYTYAKNLPSEEKSKFSIANSIWFKDNLVVEIDFLQTNADYYNAAAYKSAFDDQTIKDINNWVNKNTDGMIDKIIDEIDRDTVMYLINAIVFDAEWKEIYEKNNINSGKFTSIDGKKRNVEFMSSTENSYFSDKKVTGFKKPYAGGNYSFVALLPNEDVKINDYISSLTGEYFLNLLKNEENTSVRALLPKFSYDYKIKMNDALKKLGMPEAFSEAKADFTKIEKPEKRIVEGNIFIDEVLHKTFISVDERGTKAGAVTKVELNKESCVEGKVVNLDRPFVYAIIDNKTDLPIFIGTVMDIEE